MNLAQDKIRLQGTVNTVTNLRISPNTGIFFDQLNNHELLKDNSPPGGWLNWLTHCVHISW